MTQVVEVLPDWDLINPSSMQVLDKIGVTDFLDTLDLSLDSFTCAQRIWDQLDTEHQDLLSFLMLGGSVNVEVSSRRSMLRKTLKFLNSIGFLSVHNGMASLSGLSLLRYRGIWLFSDSPQPSPLLYFGSDSVGLARRLSPIPGEAALDLCSGPGIQALVLAKAGMCVTAVDINPVASSICRINARVNGVADRINVISGNLYDALKAIRTTEFELITANPPLLPIPKDVPYPFVGNGGPDGLMVTSSVIQGARNWLTDTGYLSTIGMLGCGFNNQSAYEKIAACLYESGLSGVLTIISSYSLGDRSPWVTGIAWSSTAHAPERFHCESDAISYISKAYQNMGYDRVCTYHLRAWRNTEAEGKGTLFIQNCSGEGNKLGPWIL